MGNFYEVAYLHTLLPKKFVAACSFSVGAVLDWAAPTNTSQNKPSLQIHL
jgi:hypothetical protein